MTNQLLEHRGFRASVEFSAEDDILVARVLDIQSLILVSAESVSELKQEFVTAVDEYIEQCEKASVKAERPYSGSFNVRIGGELHRRAALCARLRSQTLNEFVKFAIKNEVARESAPRIEATREVISHRLEYSSPTEDWFQSEVVQSEEHRFSLETRSGANYNQSKH